MSTIERSNRATFRQRVQIVMDEDDYLETEGDRMPKSRERRPARIVGLDLVYVYNAHIRKWNIASFDSSAQVQQQRADGSWGTPISKRIPYEQQESIAAMFAPDITPEVTW